VIISLGTNDVGRHKLDSDRVNDSNWNCGSNESRGVAILPSKFFSNEVKFTFSDKIGRVMKCEIITETALFHISNIYASNIPIDRKKKRFDSLLNSIGNHNDDSLQHYELFLGDFNCVLDRY